MFTESFKVVSMKFQGRFKEGTRVFQESFKCGCFKNVSRVFEGRLKGISRQFIRGFQGYLKEAKKV